MRALIGIIAAVIGMALVFPLAPWSDIFRTRVMLGGPTWGWVAAFIGMIVGALLLGKSKSERQWQPGSALALGLGLTFLVEPLVHLAILQWNAWRPSPGGVSMVFPLGVAEQSLERLLASIVMLVVIPAVVEEWFFRGRLLSWIADRLGPVQALSITTLGFAAIHGTMLQVLIALPMGLIWGLVRLRTGRLYPCIAAHGLHNALVLILGPSLLSIAVLPLLLGLSGVYLLVLAWRHGATPAPERRVAGIALATGWAAVLLAIYPFSLWHRSAWVAAAVTIMDDAKVPTLVLVARLQHMEHRRVPSPMWVHEAAQTLARRHRPMVSEREIVLVAQMTGDQAPEVMGSHPEDGHYPQLRALAMQPKESSAMIAARRALAEADPDALVGLLMENPGLLPIWYPNTPESDLFLMTLSQKLGDSYRRRLNRLVQLSHGDARALRLFLATDPKEVTPRDRRHLIMHFPGWEQALTALEETNPVAAAAWRFAPRYP